MESKLESLFQDPGRYMLSYKAFHAACDEHSVSKSKWRDTVFSEAVMPKIQAAMSGPTELWVLGVGSGSGDCPLGFVIPRNTDIVSEYAKIICPKSKWCVFLSMDFEFSQFSVDLFFACT